MADFIESTPAILRAKVGAALVMGTAGGLLTLLDPAKFSPVVQRSWVCGNGVLVGLAAWLGTGAKTSVQPGTGPRLFVAAGLGALMAIGTKLGFVVDLKIHQALLRRGVAKPRMVMALAAGVLTAAMVLLESTTQDDDSVALHGAKVVQDPEPPLAIAIV